MWLLCLSYFSTFDPRSAFDVHLRNLRMSADVIFAVRCSPPSPCANPPTPKRSRLFILQSHAEARVFAFTGETWCGQDHVDQGAVCKVLGVADQTSSPSFAIVNEYRGLQQR
jgi:hypothetical protein